MWWYPYAATTAALVVVAAAGILATEIGPWYRALEKPSWQPPDWAFGPVWTTIYCFIVVSVGHAWNAAPAGAHGAILWAVGVNFVLNMLWSALFFKLRRPLWALVEVVPLWLSIVAMVVIFARHDTLAAWLLAPYLLWVSVAAWLNLTIVRLNPRTRTFA